mgnify:CR=1 FL=1
MVEVKAFEEEYLGVLNRNHKEVMDSLASGKFEDASKEAMTKVAKEVAENYK